MLRNSLSALQSSDGKVELCALGDARRDGYRLERSLVGEGRSTASTSGCRERRRCQLCSRTHLARDQAGSRGRTLDEAVASGGPRAGVNEVERRVHVSCVSVRLHGVGSSAVVPAVTVGSPRARCGAVAGERRGRDASTKLVTVAAGVAVRHTSEGILPVAVDAIVRAGRVLIQVVFGVKGVLAERVSAGVDS